VARLLLARDGVNPDRLDHYGRTLRWWGSINGHEGVAGLLLERHDVNPVKPDTDGKTPLWSTACGGHEGVM